MADSDYKLAKMSDLTKSNVGLGNVDNTADSQKSVNYANSAGSAPAHTHIITQGDNRNDSTYPTDYSSNLIFRGLKLSTAIDSPSSDSYQYLVGLKGWSDSSGGNAWEIAFNNSGINIRNGADNSSWGSWYKLATISDIPSSLPANGGAALTSQHIISGNQIFNGLPNKGVGMTVSQVRDAIKNYFANYAEGIGSNIYVSTDAIYNWTDLTHTVIDSSVYCFIKVGGGYQGSTYGQFLLSSYDTYPLYYCGLNSGVWSPMVKISSDSDSSYLPLNGGGTITNGNITISSGVNSKIILNNTDAEGWSLIAFKDNDNTITNFGLFGGNKLCIDGAPIVVNNYTNPSSATSYVINPNTEYFLNNITSNGLTITLSSPISGIKNEYSFSFRWPGKINNATITMPSNIIWGGGQEPEFKKSNTYEVNIKYNCIDQKYYGLCSSFFWNTLEDRFEVLTKSTAANKNFIVEGTYTYNDVSITNPIIYYSNDYEQRIFPTKYNNNFAYYDINTDSIKSSETIYPSTGLMNKILVALQFDNEWSNVSYNTYLYSDMNYATLDGVILYQPPT